MALGTSFDEICERCLHKIERDRDFFEYYNVSVEEAQTLIKDQVTGYLRDAIDLLVSRCGGNIDVDFYDYDEHLGYFNFELTSREIGLLADLMYEVHFTRDETMLRCMTLRMSPTDLQRWSPSNDRNSFMNMLNNIRNENEVAISKYISTDRTTGARLTIDHSLYDYEN